MMKKKKILFVIFVVIIGLLIVIINSTINNTTHKYEKNWDIKLPEDIELIYKKKSEIGFNGDGTYYEVYSASEDLIYKIDENWNNHKNIDIEKSLNEKLGDLDVPNSEYPNFSREYIFKKINKPEDKRDCLIMLYQDEKLYILMDLL